MSTVYIDKAHTVVIEREHGNTTVTVLGHDVAEQTAVAAFPLHVAISIYQSMVDLLTAPFDEKCGAVTDGNRYTTTVTP